MFEPTIKIRIILKCEVNDVLEYGTEQQLHELL